MKLHTKILLIVIPLATVLLSLFIGNFTASPSDITGLLISKLPFSENRNYDMAFYTAILHVRLPRIIIAFVVGMSLSVTGVVFQGVFRNPLVSDQILGVSSGASMGAALAILCDAPIIMIQFSSFAFGIISVIIAYSLSRVYKTSTTLTLVLSGIIVGGFFSSLLSFMKMIADPLDKMPAIIFWLMGSFSKVSSADLGYSLIFMLVPVAVIFLIRWKINVISVGEDDAQSLGMNTKLFRLILIILCTLATSAAVAVSGVIGWVGLVVPHVARILVGPDHKALVPASLSLGGTYLLIMDNLSRCISSSEISIGILTALIGAPLFAFLLKRGTGWL